MAGLSFGLREREKEREREREAELQEAMRVAKQREAGRMQAEQERFSEQEQRLQMMTSRLEESELRAHRLAEVSSPKYACFTLHLLVLVGEGKNGWVEGGRLGADAESGGLG